MDTTKKDTNKNKQTVNLKKKKYVYNVERINSLSSRVGERSTLIDFERDSRTNVMFW